MGMWTLEGASHKEFMLEERQGGAMFKACDGTDSSILRELRACCCEVIEYSLLSDNVSSSKKVLHLLTPLKHPDRGQLVAALLVQRSVFMRVQSQSVRLIAEETPLNC